MSDVDKATETMIKNLREKTGHSLEDWVKTARATKLTKHKELLTYLKSKLGLTHGYANLITLKALQTEEQAAASGDDLVAAQYAGAKAELKPIYDALIAMIKKFGPDVEIAPKKAYVSVRRKKQFCIIQPTTATRVDVGVNLKNVTATERLEASGAFNSMVSHRVRVGAIKDVDRELIGWLKQAYDEA